MTKGKTLNIEETKTEGRVGGESPIQTILTRDQSGQGAVTVEGINRHALRTRIEQLTRERAELSGKVKDQEADHQKETRSFLLKVIKIVDSLDRMIRQSNPENDLFNSITVLRTELMQVLEDIEVLPVAMNVGDKMDPATCEVSRRDDRDDLDPDTIVAIDQRGFTWHGKILRRARVAISVSPQKTKRGSSST
jgi:molecular chaperone GrpE